MSAEFVFFIAQLSTYPEARGFRQLAFEVDDIQAIEDLEKGH